MQEPSIIENAVAAFPTSPINSEAEPDLAKQLTQLQLIWIRFRQHKLAMIGIIYLIIIIGLALLAPVMTPSKYLPYHPLTISDLTDPNFKPSRPPEVSWPPNVWTLLGTDGTEYSNSVTSLVIWGARISLLIGFVSAFASTLIGILVGAIAGYYGGWVDAVMMRITDVFLALPFLPMLILAAVMFGQGHVELIIAIFIIFYWPFVARLARASYLSLREQEFTEAAKAVGCSSTRIIFRHLLPSALRPIIVQTTLTIATFIVLEATVDFLGAGIKFPSVSWGNALSDSNNYLLAPDYNWWWVTFPGVVLALTVISVNFVGDGLGDALDVRSKV